MRAAGDARDRGAAQIDLWDWGRRTSVEAWHSGAPTARYRDAWPWQCPCSNHGLATMDPLGRTVVGAAALPSRALALIRRVAGGRCNRDPRLVANPAGSILEPSAVTIATLEFQDR